MMRRIAPARCDTYSNACTDPSGVQASTQKHGEDRGTVEQVASRHMQRVTAEPVQPFEAAALHPLWRTPARASEEIEARPDAETGNRRAPGAADRVCQDLLARRAHGQEDESCRMRQDKFDGCRQRGRVPLEAARRIIMGDRGYPVSRDERRQPTR